MLYTYDVCLREEAQPGVGRGGRENRFGALCVIVCDQIKLEHESLAIGVSTMMLGTDHVCVCVCVCVRRH